MDFTPEAFEKLKQELRLKNTEKQENSKHMKRIIQATYYSRSFEESKKRTIEKMEYWELKNKYR